MAFMKRDVNLGLLILIIFSIFLFSGFSVYYQTTFKDISLEYQQKLKQLGKVTEDLGAKKQELNETYKLRIKVEEDKKILDERYKDVRDENTDLHSLSFSGSISQVSIFIFLFCKGFYRRLTRTLMTSPSFSSLSNNLVTESCN